MRLRICTHNPTRLYTNASVPDLVRPYLLPGAVPRYSRFEEGWMFSQHLAGAGFRIADFHISLQQRVTMIPETDSETVLVAYLLRGRANGVLHTIPGDLRFMESHAYFLQFVPGPGNEMYLQPGDYRVVVLLFEHDIQSTLLSEFPRLQPAYRTEQAIINGRLPYPPICIGFKEYYHINRILTYKGNPNRIGFFLKTKVHVLLCRLMERLDEADAVPQKIRDVQDYIARQLHRRPSIDELRKVACMNRNDLSRVFKAHCGMTLKEYMRHERMLHACALLERKTKTPKEISAKLGYRRISNFSADFRRWAGCSLTEFLAAPASRTPKSVF